jgi:hypothetical protein
MLDSYLNNIHFCERRQNIMLKIELVDRLDLSAPPVEVDQ